MSEDGTGESHQSTFWWLEEHASEFKYYPYLRQTKKIKSRYTYFPQNIKDKLVNNYEEVWHWNYIK